MISHIKKIETKFFIIVIYINREDAKEKELNTIQNQLVRKIRKILKINLKIQQDQNPQMFKKRQKEKIKNKNNICI